MPKLFGCLAFFLHYILVASKNSIFARFENAFFIFWHFQDVLVLSTTWMTCFAVVWATWAYDDKCSIFSLALVPMYVQLCPKRWFPFNSRIVRTHFSSIMTLNNWKMIAETRCYMFKWRSRFRRRRVYLSSLTTATKTSQINYLIGWTGKIIIIVLHVRHAPIDSNNRDVVNITQMSILEQRFRCCSHCCFSFINSLAFTKKKYHRSYVPGRHCHGLGSNWSCESKETVWKYWWKKAST